MTFITPDQARYSGEIIKALELSAAKVSPDVLELWNKFKEEQQAVSGFIFLRSFFQVKLNYFEIIIL